MNSYILDEQSQKLVEDNLKLVPYVVVRRYGAAAARDDDLISIGNIALCKAAATYKDGHGVKFSSYAVQCINNEYRWYMRDQHRMTRYNGMPTESLNRECSLEDEEAHELIDFLTDDTVDVENQAIDRIISEGLEKYVPTFAKMQELNTDIRGLARLEHKTKQGIHSRMQREFRRARIALGAESIPA